MPRFIISCACVPCSDTLPAAITTMLSAFLTVDSLAHKRMHLRPFMQACQVHRCLRLRAAAWMKGPPVAERGQAKRCSCSVWVAGSSGVDRLTCER